MGYLLFAVNLTFQVAGQLLLKTGVNNSGGNWVRMLLNPHTLGGAVLLGVNMLVWIAVLRYFKLSYIYPLGSVLYILIAVGGMLWLHEKVGGIQWAGIALIVLGVTLLSTGKTA